MMTANRHREFLDGHQWILRRLSAEMTHRQENRDGWIEAERMAVSLAANEWAASHGIDRAVTTDEVEAVERTAMGYVDYAWKLALRVAELLYNDGSSQQAS